MRWQDIPRDPSLKLLRQFATAGACIFGVMGTWRVWNHPDAVMPYVLDGLALAFALLGWLKPAWLKPIFVGWMMAAFPIGWLVAHLCMALIFFGVLWPLALWFRLRGRDILRLRKPALDSYWEEKPEPADVRSYFRQF